MAKHKQSKAEEGKDAKELIPDDVINIITMLFPSSIDVHNNDLARLNIVSMFNPQRTPTPTIMLL